MAIFRVVEYFFVAYFIHNSLYLWIPYPCIAPPPSMFLLMIGFVGLGKEDHSVSHHLHHLISRYIPSTCLITFDVDLTPGQRWCLSGLSTLQLLFLSFSMCCTIYKEVMHSPHLRSGIYFPPPWTEYPQSLFGILLPGIWASSSPFTNVFNHLLYQYRLMNIYIVFWVTSNIMLFILLLKLSQL